jgi:o-succinylbenzoate synthase
MLQCDYIKTSLKFLQPAGTSRGVLHEKESWFIRLRNSDDPETVGIGECSLIPGLSPDSIPVFEQQLRAVCQSVGNFVPGKRDGPGTAFPSEEGLTPLKKGQSHLDKERGASDNEQNPNASYGSPDEKMHGKDKESSKLSNKESNTIQNGPNAHQDSLTAEILSNIELSAFPAIRFGLETALRDLEQGGKRLLYPSDFTTGTTGIPINGLIWMGNKREMLSRIAEKLDQGFSVLKMKVGALNFDDELEILHALRKEHPPAQLELRLDANGAWQPDEALEKLKVLSEFGIHSVEQPIPAGTPEEMARVCTNSPIPIALDEELIGVHTPEQKEQLLATIKPHYIILKPSLLGGIKASDEWIGLAEKQGTGWWVTSALESNIGLNAIAQWTATLETSLPQGLGTGSLFANNIPSPLTVTGSRLFYRPEKPWNLSPLKF